MTVVVAVASHNIEIVLGMEPASWGTVHVGLAESLTVLQMYKMRVVVAEVDAVHSNLEVVLRVVPSCWETVHVGSFEVLHSY